MGTIEGGRKAAATNKMRYGVEFYRTIGKMGGVKSRGGGFAYNRDLAREAGRVGGLLSKRRFTEEQKAKLSTARARLWQEQQKQKQAA